MRNSRYCLRPSRLSIDEGVDCLPPLWAENRVMGTWHEKVTKGEYNPFAAGTITFTLNRKKCSWNKIRMQLFFLPPDVALQSAFGCFKRFLVCAESIDVVGGDVVVAVVEDGVQKPRRTCKTRARRIVLVERGVTTREPGTSYNYLLGIWRADNIINNTHPHHRHLFRPTVAWWWWWFIGGGQTLNSVWIYALDYGRFSAGMWQQQPGNRVPSKSVTRSDQLANPVLSHTCSMWPTWASSTRGIIQLSCSSHI